MFRADRNIQCGCIKYPEMARVTVRNSEPTMWSWSQYDNDDMWQGYSLQIRSSVMFLRTWKTPFIATSLAYINCLIWRPRQMFNGTLKNTRRPEKTNFSRTAEYINTKTQLVTKSKICRYVFFLQMNLSHWFLPRAFQGEYFSPFRIDN